jgi:hypothetical protein
MFLLEKSLFAQPHTQAFLADERQHGFYFSDITLKWSKCSCGILCVLSSAEPFIPVSERIK